MTRLNKPWVHFVVLGLFFYQLQSAIFPEPRPVVSPLSESRIETLKKQWLTSTGREPTPEQVAKYVAAELDRDMLLQHALGLEFHLVDAIVYQRLIRNMKFLKLAEGKSDQELFEQAIEMRLHLDDEVVKRRLIQMMEQRLLSIYPPLAPTAEDVKAEFELRKMELQQPPRYSFEHVFFTENRAAEVPIIVAKISEQQLDIVAARSLGSPFLQGRRFIEQTPDQLARNFGQHFVQTLQQEPNALGWVGPIPSAYGYHYLWLSGFEPARDAEFDEVKQQLLLDLEYVANKRGLACAIAQLRSKYTMPEMARQSGSFVEESCQ